MTYANRVCHFIDGGRPFPDVALLYYAEGRWAGEGLSSFQEARILTQEQIDFHIIPADVFAEGNKYNFTLEDKKLIINGNKYKAFIITGCEYVEKDVAEFIEAAIKCEYPVIFTEYLPHGMIGAAQNENKRFQELVKRCHLVERSELGAAVKTMISPEVMLAEQRFRDLTVYHYKNESDMYLLLNENPEKKFGGVVRVKSNGDVFRYYPWENKVAEVKTEEIPGGTKMYIEIAPLELCILVFSGACLEIASRNFQTRSNIPKQILFNSEKHWKEVREVTSFQVAKVEAKEYDALREQCKYSTEMIKAPFTGMQMLYPDFSGYYIYMMQEELDSGNEYWLEIEDVSEAVEVFVNGHSTGMKLQKPFCFQLSDGNIQGVCHIRIEVATTLERKLYYAGNDIESMSAKCPLSPTGIIGKVFLKQAKIV